MPIFAPPQPIPTQLTLPLPYFKKSLLIYAPGDLPDDATRKIHAWTGRAKYNGWRIIAGDSTGTDATIARLCKLQEIPLKTYGTGARPRNNTSTRHYTRLVQYTGQPDRNTHRDRYMVEQSDIIVCVWDGVSHETISVYEYAKSFKHKQVYLSTHPMPWIKCRKRRAGYVSMKKFNAIQIDELIQKAYPNVNTSTYIH